MNAPANAPTKLHPPLQSARLVLPCRELTPLLDFLTGVLGLKLERIFPADDPAVADLTGLGLNLRLQRQPGGSPESSGPTGPSETGARRPVHLLATVDLSAWPAGAPRVLHGPEGWTVELVDSAVHIDVPAGHQAFVLSQLPAGDTGEGWGVGRAGMRYRDLIPDRLGGRFIASHIAIPEGGPVPDYVHYHHVRFQMIFCKAGWVRVVYEDQGEPFLLEAGDCVLQPPGIRHRVLEASPGLEVVEIGCPAIHETCVDPTLELPNATVNPERLFGGQKFVRHISAAAPWQAAAGWPASEGSARAEARDTGIGAATFGLAQVQVVRSAPGFSATLQHSGEFRLLFVLDGTLQLASAAHGEHTLTTGDSAVLPAQEAFSATSAGGFRVLEVAL